MIETSKEVPDQAQAIVRNVMSECKKIVVGKTEVIEDLLVALLSEGHVLLEGIPGVAKTTICKTFANVLALSFNRIQGRPDILPADVTGTHIFDPSSGSFRLMKGPIFTSILLIDEINRNTPKTNSAVLEAMQERHVTIEGETQQLPYPFMVIATQSSVELQGIFPLPEVLVDRFLFKLNTGYPTMSEEIEITNRIYSIETGKVDKVSTSKQFSYLVELTRNVYIAPQVRSYIVDLVHRTRNKEEISLGASPRASIALSKATRARALIKGKLYVLPDDVKYLAPRVLSHRLILSASGRSQELSIDKVISNLLEETPIPERSSLT